MGGEGRNRAGATVWRRQYRLCAATAAAGALAVFAFAAAGATAANGPYPVTSASLAQDGQELVWTVELGHPFSAARLKAQHRSLCLMTKPASKGGSAGVLCVAGEHASHERDRAPHLVYAQLVRGNPGPAHRIAASISRTGRERLSARFVPTAIGLPYKPVRWQVLSTARGPACQTRTGTCTSAFPVRPALARLHTPRLVGCVASGPPWVTSGSPHRREVALTFDDGPWSDTPQFLTILERERVPATFFQIGRQVSTYGPAVDRRMLVDGDMIGDHTWSHADVAGDGSFARAQIAETAAAIRKLTGFTPCLFRAPGGDVSSALISEARRMGFTTIQWDVDPRDWSEPGVGAIYSNVIHNVHNGAIVIQHDGGGDRPQTLAALPREIDTLRKDGYQFVTVTELLGQRLIYK